MKASCYEHGNALFDILRTPHSGRGASGLLQRLFTRGESWRVVAIRRGLCGGSG
jgi:hypothetical protein